MVKFKVTNDKSSWLGHVGEYVRDAGEAVVLRMVGSRLVEFDPAHVEAVEPEAAPEVKPEAE